MARTTFSGPVAGTYVTIPITFDDIVPDEDTIFRVVAPWNFRIHEICMVADTRAPTTTYQFTNQTTGVDIIATRACPASDTPEVITPTSSPALPAAARNVTKGDILRLTIDVNVAGALAGVCFTITGHTTGHAVASGAD